MSAITSTLVIGVVVGIKTWRGTAKLLTHTVGVEPVPESYVQGSKLKVGLLARCDPLHELTT